MWETDADICTLGSLSLPSELNSTLLCLNYLNSFVSQALKLPGSETFASYARVNIGAQGEQGRQSPVRRQLGHALQFKVAPATSSNDSQHLVLSLIVWVAAPIMITQPLSLFSFYRFCSDLMASVYSQLLFCWHLLTCPLSMRPLSSVHSKRDSKT